MTVITKVEPLDEDIRIVISDLLSPEAQSAAFADFATQALADAEATDAQALGYTPTHTTFVDGGETDDLSSVRPNGTIVFVFDIVLDVLTWLDEQLQLHSPVGSGRDPHPGLYKKSHVLYADGTEVDITAKPVPVASEYVFLNTTDYTRKIEAGESPQAPDGVYEGLASMANSKFGNIAAIKFSYRAPFQGQIIAYRELGVSRQRDDGDITKNRGRFAAAKVSQSVRRVANIERDLRVPAIIVTPR